MKDINRNGSRTNTQSIRRPKVVQTDTGGCEIRAKSRVWKEERRVDNLVRNCIARVGADNETIVMSEKGLLNHELRL